MDIAEPSQTAVGELVLGVDGGGSRCTAVLVRRQPAGIDELGRGHGGPANAVAVGFDEAAASVAAAVDAAFAAAQLPVQTVASACLGLAGVGQVDVRLRWDAWCRERSLASAVEIMPDGVPAFDSPPLPGWGLLVISGTGSIVWGRDASGGLHRCGGRGGLIGDEGSGLAIATAGLRAAIRSHDGWGPATCLLAAAVQHMSVDGPDDLPAAVAAATMSRAAIARFAPRVIAAAEAGDPEAGRIVAEAAADLGRQSLAVLRRLGPQSEAYPLRLTGGLLCNSPLLQQTLMAWLTSAGYPPAAVAAVDDLALSAATAAASSSRQQF